MSEKQIKLSDKEILGIIADAFWVANQQTQLQPSYTRSERLAALEEMQMRLDEAFAFTKSQLNKPE